MRLTPKAALRKGPSLLLLGDHGIIAAPELTSLTAVTYPRAHQNRKHHQTGHADLEGALKGLGIPRAFAVQEVPAALRLGFMEGLGSSAYMRIFLLEAHPQSAFSFAQHIIGGSKASTLQVPWLSIKHRSEGCSRGHSHRPSNGQGNVDANVGHNGQLVCNRGACVP